MNITRLEQRLEEQTGSSWTIGVSTLLSPHDPAKGIIDLLDITKGLSRIEIALARQLDDEDEAADRLTGLKKKHDLQYSVHAPFLYDDLAHPKDSVRKIYVDEGRKAIDLATKIGALHTVFHPGELFFRQNLPPVELFESFRISRENYVSNSLKSLTTLSEYASGHGVTLLVENLPHGLCDGPEEMRYILSRLDNSSFLLDIGHANISGTLDQLLDLEPRYFHFNDNDGVEDDHRRLGEGTIDFDLLFERLRGYGGNKTIILELYSLEDVLASLEVFENTLAA